MAAVYIYILDAGNIPLKTDVDIFYLYFWKHQSGVMTVYAIKLNANKFDL